MEKYHARKKKRLQKSKKQVKNSKPKSISFNPRPGHDWPGFSVGQTTSGRNAYQGKKHRQEEMKPKPSYKQKTSGQIHSGK
jgi:hypothetical protein